MIEVPRGVIEYIEQSKQELERKEQVLNNSISIAYAPYDIVTDENGCVGFIQEVQINECQSNCCRSYAVNWIVQGSTPNHKHAWFEQSELTVHGNVFVEIARNACHPMGTNTKYVERLITNNGN